MEKIPSQEPREHSAIDDLRSKFINKEINVNAFLDEVLRLDQTDPERKSSIYAAEILSEPEVVSLIEQTPEKNKFYSIRSLTYFHKAQVALSEGKTDAKQDILKALHDSERIGKEDEDWAEYLRATISYLDNDLEGLKNHAANVETNKSLVQNLISGLEYRGEPDYLADYAKPRHETT